MTTERIDPLAVMARLIGNARTMAGLSGDPILRDNVRDGEKALTAVAELVEAAQVLKAAREAEVDSNVAIKSSTYARLFLALAAFGRQG